MSIIKYSFLALFVVALIPTSQGNQYSLLMILQNTTNDLGQFCTRTPETCQEAAKAASSLKDKAEYIKNALVNTFSSSNLKTATIGQKSDRLDYADIVRQEPENKLAAEDIADEAYRASTRETANDIRKKLEEGSSENTLTNKDKNLNEEDKAAQWIEPTKDRQTRVSGLWN